MFWIHFWFSCAVSYVDGKAAPMTDITTDPCPCRCCSVKSRTDCSRYYLCVDNVRFSKKCNNGLVFNEDIQNCDYKDNVICPSKPPVPQNFTCPSATGLFPYDPDCSWYIQCSHRIPYVMPCPPNLLFNRNEKLCDYKENTDCIEDYPWPTDIPGVSDEELYIMKWQCPELSGIFAHPKSTSKYIICKGGVPSIMKCSTGLQFNQQTKQCDW
ncbi:peritrophin-1-like [Tachypleus tridentatus]|uniref:peritrophin-1-like n=1 Tax=Tachypleus tridentatus TaxID=6853 RepID=UPI003FD275BE